MAETIRQEVQVSLPLDLFTGIIQRLGPAELRRVRDAVEEAERQHSSSEEDWLDVECHALAAQEADDRITLTEVRDALAKIPGSLVADFRAEREER